MYAWRAGTTQPYSYSVSCPHRFFKNSSTVQYSLGGYYLEINGRGGVGDKGTRLGMMVWKNRGILRRKWHAGKKYIDRDARYEFRGKLYSIVNPLLYFMNIGSPIQKTVRNLLFLY